LLPTLTPITFREGKGNSLSESRAFVLVKLLAFQNRDSETVSRPSASFNTYDLRQQSGSVLKSLIVARAEEKSMCRPALCFDLMQRFSAFSGQSLLQNNQHSMLSVNVKLLPCSIAKPRPNGPTALLPSSISAEFGLALVFASSLVHFDCLIAWPPGPDAFGGGMNH
jgi:hypothetical protein